MRWIQIATLTAMAAACSPTTSTVQTAPPEQPAVATRVKAMRDKNADEKAEDEKRLRELQAESDSAPKVYYQRVETKTRLDK